MQIFGRTSVFTLLFLSSVAFGSPRQIRVDVKYILPGDPEAQCSLIPNSVEQLGQVAFPGYRITDVRLLPEPWREVLGNPIDPKNGPVLLISARRFPQAPTNIKNAAFHSSFLFPVYLRSGKQIGKTVHTNRLRFSRAFFDPVFQRVLFWGHSFPPSDSGPPPAKNELSEVARIDLKTGCSNGCSFAPFPFDPRINTHHLLNHPNLNRGLVWPSPDGKNTLVGMMKRTSNGGTKAQNFGYDIFSYFEEEQRLIPVYRSNSRTNPVQSLSFDLTGNHFVYTDGTKQASLYVKTSPSRFERSIEAVSLYDKVHENPDRLESVALHPAASSLAYAYYSNEDTQTRVRVKNIRPDLPEVNKEVPSLRGATQLEFSPDGQFLGGISEGNPSTLLIKNLVTGYGKRMDFGAGKIEGFSFSKGDPFLTLWITKPGQSRSEIYVFKLLF